MSKPRNGWAAIPQGYKHVIDGFLNRFRYTNRHKAMVLSYYLEPVHRSLSGRGPRHRTLPEVAEYTKISLDTIEKWSRPKARAKIFAEKASLHCVQPSKPKWPLLEDRLHEEFLVMRDRARPVRLRWFRVNSKRLFSECYPTDRSGESDFIFSTGVILCRLSKI
jgi:hypothetical protein